MFHRVDQPAFHIHSHGWARTNAPLPADIAGVAFIRWDFTFKPKGSRDTIVWQGMSEVHFGIAGRVVAHYDHWDAGQLYEKIPILGAMIRFVRRKMTV
jgi:hypothetical protein